MKKLLFVIAILTCFSSFAQKKFPTLSDQATISLITIGPGPELYDAFGHTSIRVKDPVNNLDTVFNYGVFDFDTPNFYLKFARGKLLYKLDVASYENFEYNYKSQQRWIKSQKLEMTPAQLQETYNFLRTNLQEENRYYKYDFFYDNCATRPYYAIARSLDGNLEMDYSEQGSGLTHRELIRQYIPWNSWGGLGIDVALGSVIDREATPEEYLFLPNELMSAFAKAKIKTSTGDKAFVKNTENVFQPNVTYSYGSSFILSPLFILGLLGLLLLYKTYRDYTSNVHLGWLDSAILMITGILGLLVGFLWFGTDHIATGWNYNLLWAFPFHILASFVVLKNNPPRWIYPYMKLATIMMFLLFFHWIVGVQSYAPALLPLLIAITLRYLFILRKLKEKRTISEQAVR